jgi:hypothetical protein
MRIVLLLSALASLLAPAPQASPWSAAARADLLAWRGFISTLTARIPCGPRPNDPTNMVFAPEYMSPCYSDSDRAAMRKAARAAGYTHWPLNPVISAGYHRLYPNQDWRTNIDGYLNHAEALWRDGLYPVFFLLPDTGVCTSNERIDRACVERELTPLFSQPRFQALARIVVIAWEPRYSADDWKWSADYMHRVFPRALRGIHTISDHERPCLDSELKSNGGSIFNVEECWRPVSPKIDFYLMQQSHLFNAKHGACDEKRPTVCRTAEQQFLYNLWDVGSRLAGDRRKWIFDGNPPVALINFEYGSMKSTLQPDLIGKARAWGDLSLSAPPFIDPITGERVDAARYVRGYGDGGTLKPKVR